MDVNYSISASLGKHWHEFVQEELATGEYNNASEVLRRGLKLLEDARRQQRLQEADLKLREQELGEMLMKGRNSPRAGTGAEVRERGRARLRRKHGVEK